MRFADGHRETAPANERPSKAAELADVEDTLVAASDEARRLAEELQDAARTVTTARAQLAVVEHDLGAMGHQPLALSPLPQPIVYVKPQKRSWLVRLFAWIASLFVRRPHRALPEPERETVEAALPPDMETLVAGSPRGMAKIEKRVAEEAQRLQPATERMAQLEQKLVASKARLATLVAERDQILRVLESQRDVRREKIASRIQVVSVGGEGPLLIEMDVPAMPDRVTVVLSLESAGADVTLRLDHAPAREEIVGRLAQIRNEQPVEVARRVSAGLCACRNHILDLERRIRHAHDERVSELDARRVPVETRGAREHAVAQLPVARHAEQIVQDAATRLERLLQEVRLAWEARIEGCTGIEQLRAEVAAIENGASYRLSLVCDELRENMTVQFVRLVLELTQPLRQELLHKRIEVARGSSAKLEETFEDIRVTLPASIDQTFGALRAPELGELMNTDRGLLDPLFRTLTRDKRECTRRLRARLDDIERTTARELFAAAVYLSPMLLQTLRGLVEELLTMHARWITARIDEAELAFASECARQEPAVALVDPLRQHEERLGRLLDATYGGASA